MTRNYEAEVDKAMAACQRCKRLAAHAFDQHRNHVLDEILRTQSRPLFTLPANVWDGQRPPQSKGEAW